MTRSNSAFIANVWSEQALMIVNNNLSTSASISIIVNNLTPIEAFISTFLLIWAYTVMLSLIIFLINLFKGKLFGFSIICAIHVLGFLAQYANYGIIQFISPAINARLEFHNFGYNNYLPSLTFSTIYFLLIIILIIIILLRISKRIIFNSCNECS